MLRTNNYASVSNSFVKFGAVAGLTVAALLLAYVLAPRASLRSHGIELMQDLSRASKQFALPELYEVESETSEEDRLSPQSEEDFPALQAKKLLIRHRFHLIIDIVAPIFFLPQIHHYSLTRSTRAPPQKL